MTDIGSQLQLMHGRLERLERQNRRLRVCALGLVLVGGTALLMGQAKPQEPPRVPELTQGRVVEAQLFRLVDKEGRERAVLGMSGDGPILRLCEEGGKTRVGLGMTSEGASISLHDRAGDLALSLTVARKGPGIVMNDRDRPRLLLSGGRDSAGLNINDSSGRTTISLIETTRGCTLGMGGTPDHPLVAIQTRENSGAMMLYKSGSERPVWQAP